MTENRIKIVNASQACTEVDIEGVIGVPEELQFENDRRRVATYEKFRSELERIKAISSPEVVVNIRSGGGNVNDAVLIYDALSSLQAVITTRCYGYVASAATIIAQAAASGKREISENALYLIHKSVALSEGNSRDINETVELLEKTDQRIAAIYARRSGRAAEEFAALMECNNGNGRWLSPEETIAAGLADNIIPATTGSTAAVFDSVTESAVGSGFGSASDSAALLAGTKKGALRQHWNAILDLLKIREGASGLSSAGAAGTSGEISAKTSSSGPGGPEASAPVKIEPEADKQAAPQSVARRFDIGNLRAAALPTTTEPVEDPSPTQVGGLSVNEQAYHEDARNFIR